MVKRKPGRSDGRCKLTGKVRYHDSASATRAMRNLVRHRNELPADRTLPTRVYECQACGGWHWTGRTERPRR